MCTSHQAHRYGLCQFFFTLHFLAEHSEGTFPHARHQQPALAAALTSMVRNGVFPGVQDPFVGQALASLPDIAAVGSAFYTFYWPPRPPDVTFGRQGRQRGRMGFWCAFLTTSFHPQFMCFVFRKEMACPRATVNLSTISPRAQALPKFQALQRKAHNQPHHRHHHRQEQQHKPPTEHLRHLRTCTSAFGHSPLPLPPSGVAGDRKKK